MADRMSEGEDEQREALRQMFVGVGFSMISYPLTCAKTLIQLGYEPLHAVPVKAWNGSTHLMYPNIFKYVRQLMREEGLGILRGFGPKIISTGIESAVASEAKIYAEQRFGVNRHSGESDDWGEWARYVSAESVGTAVGIVVSQPFRVLMVRQISYIISKDEAYKNVMSSIGEIWESDGILGFFAGLVPRVLAEVTVLWLARLFCRVLTQNMTVQAGENKQIYDKLAAFSSNLLAGQLTYPLQVVATCMTVSGSKRIAGQPSFDGWTSCYRQLAQMGALKRGSSMFFRYKPIKFGDTLV